MANNLYIMKLSFDDGNEEGIDLVLADSTEEAYTFWLEQSQEVQYGDSEGEEEARKHLKSIICIGHETFHDNGVIPWNNTADEVEIPGPIFYKETKKLYLITCLDDDGDPFAKSHIGTSAEEAYRVVCEIWEDPDTEDEEDREVAADTEREARKTMHIWETPLEYTNDNGIVGLETQEVSLPKPLFYIET